MGRERQVSHRVGRKELTGEKWGLAAEGAGLPAPVAAQQAYQRLSDDAHLCLRRQVEVKLRYRHYHRGAAALQ